MESRLSPPVWRHDAFTLRALQAAIEREVKRLAAEGVLTRDHSVVVDVGAGDAPYRALFEPHCSQYVACDLEAGPGVDVVLAPDGTVALPAGSASCVVSFQVLEHVWDVDAYLYECARLMAANGRLVLSTHGTWLYHPHPGDYRRWTRDGLARELEERGYAVESMVPVVGALAWTTQFRLLAYHHVLSRLPGVGKIVAAVVAAGMYFRMRVEDALTPDAIKADNAAVYLLVAKHVG